MDRWEKGAPACSVLAPQGAGDSRNGTARAGQPTASSGYKSHGASSRVAVPAG